MEIKNIEVLDLTNQKEKVLSKIEKIKQMINNAQKLEENH